MEYKRITEKTFDCFCYDLKDFNHKTGEFGDYDTFFAYAMAVRRLGELEDKIEQGTLIELPCIMKKSCGGWGVWFYSTEYQMIDSYRFTTKAAAEEKFKELKGKTEG